MKGSNPLPPGNKPKAPPNPPRACNNLAIYTNPVIWMVLYYRYHKVKHSQIDWAIMRLRYDYTQEQEHTNEAI